MNWPGAVNVLIGQLPVAVAEVLLFQRRAADSGQCGERAVGVVGMLLQPSHRAGRVLCNDVAQTVGAADSCIAMDDNITPEGREEKPRPVTL
jgi:hypothetical protein